jgi:hypothetical protein
MELIIHHHNESILGQLNQVEDDLLFGIGGAMSVNLI